MVSAPLRLKFGLSACGLQGEGLDLISRLHVQDHAQALLCGSSGPVNCVELQGLELGKSIAQVVDAAFVDGLELLKDEGRLRTPLLVCILDIRAGSRNLPCRSLGALVLQLVCPLLRSLDFLSHVGHVTADGRHGLHLAVRLVELAQRALNIGFQLLGQRMVRFGERLCCADDPLPWQRKDPVSGSARARALQGEGSRDVP